MSLETIFGLVNLDKIAGIFFSLTSAFFSLETFTILYLIALVGGFLFSFEYFLAKRYRQTIQETSGVMVDLELKAPTPVTIDGKREVITPDTVEQYLPHNQDLSNVNPYIEEVDKFTKFLTVIQLLITLPFSIIYAPILHLVTKRKLSTVAPKRQVRVMLQLYYTSNKVTSILKWLWTIVLSILLIVTISVIAIATLLGGLWFLTGGVLS